MKGGNALPKHKQPPSPRAGPVRVRRTAPQVFALTVPVSVARYIAGTSEWDELERFFAAYEFDVEATDEGILYRPALVHRVRGWDAGREEHGGDTHP